MLANRLRVTRKSHHLTQEMLAEKTGLIREMIGRYETGKATPDLSTVIKIADALDVSIDYLLGRSDEPGIVKPHQEPDESATSDSKPAEPFSFFSRGETFSISDETINRLSEIIAKRLEENGQGEKLG